MTDSFSFDLFISSISLDTREWATLLVLVTLLLLAVAFAKNKLDYFISVASSLFDVCKAALSIWIVVPAALIVGWSCLVFWATFESGFWSYSNSTDVIESILFSGMGSMAIVVRAKSGQGLFHELVINEFALSTVTSFYVGLECFPIAVEYVIQMTAMLIALSETVLSKRGGEQNARLFAKVNSFIGLAIFAGTTVLLVSNIGDIDLISTLRSAAIPVWYAIAMLPFAYLLSLFSNYQVLSKRLRHVFHIPPVIRFFLYLCLGPRIRLVKNIGNWQWKLKDCNTFGDVRRVVSGYRRDLSIRTEVAKQKRDRVENGIGTKGFDSNGIWLDVRQFSKVHTALNGMLVTAMNSYESKKLYEANEDLLKLLLPDGCTGKIWVSKDHKSWGCWISNPSGFTFAIALKGNTNKPKYYEGIRPPLFGEPNWDTLFYEHECELPNWNYDESYESSLL